MIKKEDLSQSRKKRKGGGNDQKTAGEGGRLFLKPKRDSTFLKTDVPKETSKRKVFGRRGIARSFLITVEGGERKWGKTERR